MQLVGQKDAQPEFDTNGNRSGSYHKNRQTYSAHKKRNRADNQGGRLPAHRGRPGCPEKPHWLA